MSFSPIQLGVGVSGWLEAAVHAARRYIEHMDQDTAIVKLDFRNAFNTIRRDAILENVAVTLPESYAYIHASYASYSHLAFGEHVIQSSEGGATGRPARSHFVLPHYPSTSFTVPV